MRILIVTIASFAAAAALVVSGCGSSETAGTAEESGSAAKPAAEQSGPTLPSSATVTMGEWFFRADQPRVKAGKVTLIARNVGKIDHELIAVKTSLPPHRMPMAHDGVELDLEKAGMVMIGEAHEHSHADEEDAGEHMDDEEPGEHMDDEDAGEHMDGEAAEDHLEPGETRRYTVSLKPGKYVLLCSIPGHYQSGQRMGLTVQQSG